MHITSAHAGETAYEQITPQMVDRVLSAPIPGGSAARDWFVSHDAPRAAENVKEVARRMAAAAVDELGLLPRLAGLDAMVRAACRIHTQHMVHRYLISNSDGRLDGHEKAVRHGELCRFYVAFFFGHDDPDTARHDHEEAFQAVHTATQAQLTDFLDEVIGFPLKGRPDYDDLVPKFFNKFHDIAMAALTGLKG